MKFYVFDTFPSELSKYKKCIVLIHDKWDDWFKYETQCNVNYVTDNQETTYIGEVKIGQLGMNGQRTASYPNEFEELPNNYFSLGQSEEYYENIKNVFNEADRVRYYKALRDIAFDLTLYKSVKKEDVTRTSLMRSVSSFMIEHQFNRIAMGNARLTKYKIEYEYPLEHTESPTKLSFYVEPDSCPPTNIHVIIGRNNVGKTYLIKHFISAAYDKSANLIQNGMLKATNSNTGRLVNSRTQQAFANILCISFSPFDDYEEIKQLHKNKSMPFSFIGLDDKEQSLSGKFVKSLIQCQCGKRKMDLLYDALEMLETDPIFSQSKMKEMINLPCNEIAIENQEKVQSIYKKLSSGHQVIMLSLIQLVELITERTLVILDEPENHLHPPLLSAFIRALSKLLIDKNGVAIIATHSPVILQEVPRSCVWKINRSGYEVVASRLEIESFGATIGSLTHEVFGLEVNNSGFHKMLIEEVKKGLDYEQIVDKYNDELGDEAKSLLRAMIFERNKNEKTE